MTTISISTSIDVNTVTYEDISHLYFRFLSSRDKIPTPYLHLTFSPNTDTDTVTPLENKNETENHTHTHTDIHHDGKLTIESMNSLLSIQLPRNVLGLHVASPCSAFLSFHTALDAAHAHAALHKKPVKDLSTGITGIFCVKYASVKTSSSASTPFHPMSSSSHASSNAHHSAPITPEELVSRHPSSLQFIPLEVSTTEAIQPILEKSRFVTNSSMKIAKVEETFGEALHDEDGKFQYPKPSPIPSIPALSSLISKITSLPEFEKSSLSFIPNRVTLIYLHPGRGVGLTKGIPLLSGTKVSATSPELSPVFALMSLNSYVCLDLIPPVDVNAHASDPQGPSAATQEHEVCIRAQHLLLMKNDWQWRIRTRTRDLIDGKKVKREPCVLAVFMHVNSDEVARISIETSSSNTTNSISSAADDLLANTSIPISDKSLITPPTADVGSVPTVEHNHVHEVYNAIASHFSSTRHSPWPRVEAYVKSIPAGANVLDIGCGNGKYLGLNSTINIEGIDLSEKLVEISIQRGFKAQVGDCCALPYDDKSFTHTLSIALLHHLSTVERRLKALSEMFRVTQVNGEMLICAWAMEQDKKSKRRFESQDVMVPWRLPKRYQNDSKQSNEKDSHVSPQVETDGEDIIYQRYCHVYRESELESLFDELNKSLQTTISTSNNVSHLSIMESYYDRGNWCVLVKRLQ